MGSRRIGVWSVAYLVIGVVFLVGVVVALLGASRAPDTYSVWTELSRAGVSVALITVAGAVGSVAVKRVDERRAREVELRRIMHVVLTAYNDVKAVRRNLKALGLRDGARVHQLGEDEARELRTALAQLNKAQLELEASAREIPRWAVFEDPEAARGHLRTAEKHINDTAIKVWEKSGSQLWAGNELDVSAFSRFFDEFEQSVSSPLDRFLEQVSSEIFGTKYLVS